METNTENTEKKEVPIYKKLTLSVKEAAAYSSIGETQIRYMLKQPNCPFALYIGSRVLIKREAFEKYITNAFVIDSPAVRA